MDEDGEEYSLPDVSCPFLLSYLLEVGPVTSGPFGAGPIGWTDLRDWQFCLGITLPPWQCRVLLDLSREYLAFSKEAEAEDCPSPCTDEVLIESRRESVARGLMIGFKALMKAKE